MVGIIGVVLLLAGVAGIYFGLGGLGAGDMDTRLLVAGGAAGIVGALLAMLPGR